MTNVTSLTNVTSVKTAMLGNNLQYANGLSLPELFEVLLPERKGGKFVLGHKLPPCNALCVCHILVCNESVKCTFFDEESSRSALSIVCDSALTISSEQLTPIEANQLVK